MAAQNDNQGLKIAVACFVMLSVILAVTTYFGFSYYGQTDARLKATEAERDTAKQDSAKDLKNFMDLKEKAGYSKQEGEEVGKAITKDMEELTKRIAAIVDQCRASIDSYKSSGGNLGKIDELRQSLDAIMANAETPTPKSLQATMFRLQELLANQAHIATMVTLEFHNTRKQLEDVDSVNKKQLDVEIAANQKNKEDLNAEHTSHETERQKLMVKVDALQTELNRVNSDVVKLKNTIDEQKDTFKKQSADLLVQLRYFRDIVEKKENTLDKKDGTLTFVDYKQGLVGTDLTRRQGAREQMVFTVFDRKASGIPSDQPKGSIELIRVTDTGSVGRIVNTVHSIQPLRAGDQVYSPVWDYNRPLQYALIGKIDVNRDGKDDRQDLKRMIESSGGIVSYDLPPPGIGVETGKLTPLVSWYVIDERMAYHPQTEHEAKQISGESESNFLKKRTEAIATARAEGIRPISIERLLSQLGYTYGTPVPGRVEVIDRPGVNDILHPRGRVGVLPTPEAEEKKDAVEKKEEEKKDDAKPAEEKKDDGN